MSRSFDSHPSTAGDQPRIAIVQFPGTNTERETILALRRAGLEPVEFLWNEDPAKLADCDGFILAGGFSYEDRSRAGVIASMDPVMGAIKEQAEATKPVLGICNGAQILVEAGLVPGCRNYRLGMVLTNNRRVRDGHILGTGYYNEWTNLRLTAPSERCAFTRHLTPGEWIQIPLAHGEGRFILEADLLEELINNDQTVFRYCDGEGNILPEFPTNPNGSLYNLAAVCNPAGNVMAIMPHPERTPNGDAIFTSLRDYITSESPPSKTTLAYQPPDYQIQPYQLPEGALEWLVDLVITDNEAVSVHNALAHLQVPVQISRRTHWELVLDPPGAEQEGILEQIRRSGELFNSNKEFLTNHQEASRTRSFLVRPKEDLIGRQKLGILRDWFGITGLRELKKGVLWNLTLGGDNFEADLDRVLATHILFNPFAHDCYAY